MDLARSVINPEIKLGDIILDEVQEEVAMEDYKPQEHKPIPTPSKRNSTLMVQNLVCLRMKTRKKKKIFQRRTLRLYAHLINLFEVNG